MYTTISMQTTPLLVFSSIVMLHSSVDWVNMSVLLKASSKCLNVRLKEDVREKKELIKINCL